MRSSPKARTPIGLSMSRRLLTTLLSALALLLATAPGALATPVAQSGPAASAATDDDTACSDDPDVDLPACEDDDPGDDDAGLCDAALGDDGSFDDPDAPAWSDEEESGDDGCAEEETAAVLSGLAATVAGRGARARVRVSFTLDLPSAVELTLARVESGVTRGRRCVAAPARSAAVKSRAARKGKGKAKGQDGRSCTRTTVLHGSQSLDGDAGANTTGLRRRWGGRALAPGSYRLTAEPDGGEAVTAAFTLPRR